MLPHLERQAVDVHGFLYLVTVTVDEVQLHRSDDDHGFVDHVVDSGGVDVRLRCAHAPDDTGIVRHEVPEAVAFREDDEHFTFLEFFRDLLEIRWTEVTQPSFSPVRLYQPPL